MVARRCARDHHPYPPHRYTRTGVHPVKGELTVAGLLEVAAGHLEGHLGQLKEVLEAVKEK